MQFVSPLSLESKAVLAIILNSPEYNPANFYLYFKEETMKKLLLALLVTALLLAGCSTTPAGNSAISGEFTDSAAGFGGDVTVTLTLADSVISNVVITGNGETESIGGRAMDLMGGSIIAKNTVEVDTVSGATITCDAILAAASGALSKSGATLSTVDAAILQTMVPGTYYGEEYGKWKKGTIEGERFGSPAIIGPTRVAVTVDETSILSVEVLSCDDTPGFIDPCVERIPAAIVELQSITVDCVTGCTLTSQAIMSGVSRALTEAGANLTGFVKSTPKIVATETFDCDFVVVGGGGSGTTAALTAQTAGLNVIVVEKTGMVGGESTCSTGMLTLGSKHLEEQTGVVGTPLYEVFYEMMDWASWRADASVVMSFLKNNGETADFLQNLWNGTTNPGFTRMAAPKNGMDTGKGVAKYTVLYDTYFLPQGGTLLLETTAYELILDGSGAVTGVKARRQDGAEVIINAKATLLATGGFGGNNEMLRQYLNTDSFYLYGLSTNTGDGLRMALAAGATLTPEIAPHLAEFCSNPVVDFYAGYMKFINYSGLLQVGPDGTRFYNEELGASDPLAKGASALYSKGYAYAIFTQSDLDKLEAEGGPGLLSAQTRSEISDYRPRACLPFYTIKDEMQAAIDANQGWKADTLEALGAAIGFNAAVYNPAIAEYLEMVEAGVDSLFGKRPEMLHSLDVGPYYAVRIYPALDGTLNGIRVNANMQAVDATHMPIAGLYMGGYDAGGLWAFPYYQTEHTNALTQGYSVTSGRIAGKHVAALLG